MAVPGKASLMPRPLVHPKGKQRPLMPRNNGIQTPHPLRLTQEAQPLPKPRLSRSLSPRRQIPSQSRPRQAQRFRLKTGTLIKTTEPFWTGSAPSPFSAFIQSFHPNPRSGAHHRVPVVTDGFEIDSVCPARPAGPKGNPPGFPPPSALDQARTPNPDSGWPGRSCRRGGSRRLRRRRGRR